ncbi:UNVERIFIED_CONTAM: hypothetical protein K2H54_067565 [Gekko kuhli]
MRYFYTALSEPGQGLPRFIAVGYVDDQPFVKYDSQTRRMLPEAPWMEKVVEYEAGYWERQSRRVRGAEPVFRVNLGTLRERFNQQNSTGLHTLQWMYGCEVGPDGQLSEGRYQFAYDGKDFLAFDRKTISWTAAVLQAELSKQKRDKRRDISQGLKDYLEVVCVEWLQRYLDYANETLQRTERPTARVVRKKGYEGQETLFCQLYGFYPKEIEVTWMKDKEDQKPETWTGGVVPNSDGTYNTWVSIDVDPKEKGRYRCRVGHDSLPKPLDLAWEKPATNFGLILGIAISILAVVILVVVVWVTFYMIKQRQKKGYEAASKKQPPEDGIEAPPEEQPLENGIEAPPVKRPLENGYQAILKEQPLENGIEAPLDVFGGWLLPRRRLHGSDSFQWAPEHFPDAQPPRPFLSRSSRVLTARSLTAAPRCSLAHLLEMEITVL